MMLVAITFLFLSIGVALYGVLDEELGWLFFAWILSIITVVIVVNEGMSKTSDKGYNVWKSYTISGNDTTDITWHVSEKK